ncbi:MAG: DUF6263 family protein, partial [Cyclobacteriaceae bacterium]|nr:DUF6263 family protein [Cyclobacteriaceae bacterium]
KLDVNTTYTLKESGKDFYVIAGNSEMVSADYTPTDITEPEFDLKGTMTSTIKVDAKTGWVVESNISQVLNGHTYVMADPNSLEKMEVPISIETKTAITNK